VSVYIFSFSFPDMRLGEVTILGSFLLLICLIAPGRPNNLLRYLI
jgi:hypothetical protein